MREPIAHTRRIARKKVYDPEPFITRLEELLVGHNESYREASLGAGLDHQAVRRILSGQRPQMHICILLADHFGVNPNEFLELANWPKLKIFEVRTVSGENLSPEAVEVAVQIDHIGNPGTRRVVADAINIIVGIIVGKIIEA
jgi:hypothetical protein